MKKTEVPICFIVGDKKTRALKYRHSTRPDFSKLKFADGIYHDDTTVEYYNFGRTLTKYPLKWLIYDNNNPITCHPVIVGRYWANNGGGMMIKIPELKDIEIEFTYESFHKILDDIEIRHGKIITPVKLTVKRPGGTMKAYLKVK